MAYLGSLFKVDNVFGFTTPVGPVPDSSGNPIYTCFVTIIPIGSVTYSQATNARVEDLSAALKDSTKSGKSFSIIQVQMQTPGDENGTLIGAKSFTLTGNQLDFELTGPDLSTEHAAGALGAFNRGICLSVMYKQV